MMKNLPVFRCYRVLQRQKVASDKRKRRTDNTTRDLVSTPRRTKSKQIRLKHLGRDKYASKSLQKRKCSIFDFTLDSEDVSDGKKSTEVLLVLKDISESLNTLMDRVESTEKEIKLVKSRLVNTSPSSSSDSMSSKKVQIDIPNIIRVNILVFQLIAIYFNVNV